MTEDGEPKDSERKQVEGDGEGEGEVQGDGRKSVSGEKEGDGGKQDDRGKQDDGNQQGDGAKQDDGEKEGDGVNKAIGRKAHNGKTTTTDVAIREELLAKWVVGIEIVLHCTRWGWRGIGIPTYTYMLRPWLGFRFSDTK